MRGYIGGVTPVRGLGVSTPGKMTDKGQETRLPPGASMFPPPLGTISSVYPAEVGYHYTVTSSRHRVASCVPPTCGGHRGQRIGETPDLRLPNLQLLSYGCGECPMIPRQPCSPAFH